MKDLQKKAWLPVACCCLAALLISLLPLGLLRLADRAVLDRPRPRTQQTKLLPRAEDEVYLARALAQREQAPAGDDLTQFYAKDSGMGAAEGANLLRRCLEELQTAGALPGAAAQWAQGQLTEDAAVEYRYRADESGFLTFFARQDAADFCSVTVESRTGLVTDLWLDLPSGQPAPDRDALLTAYAEYLGLGALDWQPAAETDYADTSLYCASAELLLSVQLLDYHGYDREPTQQYFLSAQALPAEEYEKQRSLWRSLYGAQKN